MFAKRSTEAVDLAGRTAVVTGGGSGLGAAITALLAARGCHVLIGSRDEERVTQAAARWREEGLAVDARRCDVTRREEVFALRDAVIDSTGRLDLWVNNAGRAGAFGPVRLTPESDFLTTTDTVIRGTYFGSLAALDAMVPKGAGDLINLLGRGDDGPVTNQAAYGSAKTWVRAFTRALASEQKGSGVRVHAFNPGLVRTDMLGRIDAVRGYGQGLARFPSVVAALGLNPDEAAEPLLGLIGSDRVEYRGTEPARLLSAALGNLRHRLRHGRSARQPIELTEVEPRSGDLP